jgi:hypothetical protein
MSSVSVHPTWIWSLAGRAVNPPNSFKAVGWNQALGGPKVGREPSNVLAQLRHQTPLREKDSVAGRRRKYLKVYPRRRGRLVF